MTNITGKCGKWEALLLDTQLDRLSLSSVSSKAIEYKVQLNCGICILQVCTLVYKSITSTFNHKCHSANNIMNTLNRS